MTFNKKATKGLVHTAVTTALVLAASVSAAQTANALTQQQEQQQREQQERERLERERQEQERKRQEEEQARQRQEQERQRQEQERRRQEQERLQREQQERQRQEEERRRQEEERRRQEQQQERQRQEQERQRQEQERQRQEQERQQRERQEQERQRQEQERKRQEEERQRQEQERKKQEQEKQKQEQEKQKQEQEKQKQEQEKQKQEQEKQKQEQERQKQEQERQRQEQERQRQEQERQRQEQERQKQEQERQKQEQEKQQQNRGGVAQGVTLPNTPVYLLTSDNAIYVLRQGANNYTRLGRVETEGGNLIGIDFRPADGKLYGLTDLGNIYTIPVTQNSVGQAQRVSTMNPRFTGGFEMLFDFNPVANAVRVAGSNDQNLAVVNGTNGANLSTTVAQTKFAYAQGDVNAGQDPELSGGAYTNNVNGATTTIFYAIDHDKDTLVTIADKTATGSSNTGGGKLQTIGNFVDQNGKKVNLSPTADIDIYTDKAGKNFLVGAAGRLLFSIDLGQINPNLQLGKTQNVVVKWGPPAALPGSDAPLTGGIWDVALPIAQ